MLKIEIRTIRLAAATEDLDWRTVLRATKGEKVKPICFERALRGLKAQGVDVSKLPKQPQKARRRD